MQAESVERRAVAAVIGAVFLAWLVFFGPSVPRAQALPNLCNLPGGTYLCEKAIEGAVWADKNVPGLHEAGEAVNSVVETVDDAIDFASDPLGYMEQKLRSGTKSMFGAFGEELTGKNPNESSKNKGD
ncbi:hypothetical protein [Streptomyces roseolus]|uniref:hypothetical protein n=1 Tax=Streptomyces roseolus TaxID=67358 RepID=UPI0037BB321B